MCYLANQLTRCRHAQSTLRFRAYIPHYMSACRSVLYPLDCYLDINPKMSTLEYTLNFTFYASPKAVLEAITDTRDIMRYTRAPAVSEPKPGGTYSVFDGNVIGEFIEATESMIHMKWRLRGWDDKIFSDVKIRLTPKGEGRTHVSLHHSGIPATDKFGHSAQEKSAESGWRERIFGGIKTGLGIGMEEED